MKDEIVYTKENVNNAIKSFTDWGNIGVQFVAERFGEEIALEYLRKCGEALLKPVIENANGSGLKVLEGIELFHRLMGSDVNILEDKTKKQLEIVKCASGDRMNKTGLFTQRMENGCPYYCFHCTMWWQDMLREAGFSFNFYYSEKSSCIYELIK